MMSDSKKKPDTHVSALTGLTPPAVSIAAPIDGLLAPMAFPVEAQDGLTATELVVMDNVLVGSVAAYLDMKWGDVIRTYLSEQEGPTQTVLAEDLEKPTIAVRFLDTLEDGSLPVTYTVTNAGNPNTSYSPAQAVQLSSRSQLPGSEWGLPAPLFTWVNAHNTLELSGGPDGTAVYINRYRTIQTGDVITLSLDGFDAMGGGSPIPAAHMTQERTVTDDEMLKNCNFTVPHFRLTALHLGRVQMCYSLGNRYGPALPLQADGYVDMRAPAVACSQLHLKL